MENRDERLVRLETEMVMVRKVQEDTLAELKGIHDQLTKYKGFIGGMAFLLSCLVTAVTIGKDILLVKLGIK